jgi:RNase P/RNase MRP subunit POP5
MEKKLKPSMREKKRYLYLETKLSRNEIEKVILDYIGILGYAKSGVSFISKDIIAVNRKNISEIRAAFSFAEIKVKLVSGSLKKLKK